MRCIVFDLDGTLIESTALYTECFQSAVTAELGSSPRFADVVASMHPTAERAFFVEWLGHESERAFTHASATSTKRARTSSSADSTPGSPSCSRAYACTERAWAS
jgi:phosphoglycolate phosphatase-like HAD superfamily hydrolase